MKIKRIITQEGILVEFNEDERFVELPIELFIKKIMDKMPNFTFQFGEDKIKSTIESKIRETIEDLKKETVKVA